MELGRERDGGGSEVFDYPLGRVTGIRCVGTEKRREKVVVLRELQ
jgi:hypothetical protein